MWTLLYKKTHTLETKIAVMWRAGTNLEQITTGRLSSLVEEIYDINRDLELVSRKL